jgi:hypothetical protein
MSKALWGVVFLATAVGCGENESERTPTTPEGSGGEVPFGGEGHQTGGQPDSGGGGAAAGGGAAGECVTTWGDAGAAEELDVPGCLTLKVPEATFLIEAMPDPGSNVCQGRLPDDCRIGPWLMAFHTLADGKLEAWLVSADRAQWGFEHDLEVAAFELQEEDGVFRLPPKGEATLATYSYNEDRVPGVCLTSRGQVFAGAPDVGSTFSFFDEDEDGVADGVVLSGNVKGLGARGGDYDDDCGDDSFPLATRGHVVDRRVYLTAEGDALQPRLIAHEGFLKEGSASVLGPRGWVEARPLTLSSGFTYGYAANVVLQPGAPLKWQFDVADSFDRRLAGELSFGESEFWLKVQDGSFESFDIGEEWGTEDAYVEATCNPSARAEETELPPIGGARSLVIDQNGYRDRFRFTRSGDPTRLTFVAFGSVQVELATVGSLDETPFVQAPVVTPADCEQYAAFCAQVPAGELKHYSVDLPDGDADVLVRLYNAGKTAWASGGGADLCVDDLTLE